MGNPQRSVTGRYLCRRCHRRLRNRSVGRGLGSSSGAAAAGSWLGRVRRAMGRGD
ncbi:hypothetical protein [Ornithinicoccus hortensis]|nr:hypothetical protein [Ornithinicoccus hortensis]